MPVIQCKKNKKWRVGSGPCVFKTKKEAEAAQRAMYAKKSKKR